MKNEKWDDVHGNTTPDDRMVAFLESPTDSYAILQLREDVDDNIPLMFANYSYLQKKEMEPEIDRYEVVYHGSISMSEDVNRQLEDLYVKFNIDHPDDFRGHSMSVSDIVALKVVGGGILSLCRFCWVSEAGKLYEVRKLPEKGQRWQWKMIMG